MWCDLPPFGLPPCHLTKDTQQLGKRTDNNGKQIIQIVLSLCNFARHAHVLRVRHRVKFDTRHMPKPFLALWIVPWILVLYNGP